MTEEAGLVRDSLHFSIPSLPPSVNALYNVLFSLRRVELKPEVRFWKTQAKQFMPVWSKKLNEQSRLIIKFTFCSNWYFKNGKLRKLDLQNLEKCLIDAIAERYGFGDECIFKKETLKVQFEKDRIECELWDFDS